tara:strand:+ start:160 stop:843 length:684 start_codon:yes stop_codon:yes gene_type:complete
MAISPRSRGLGNIGSIVNRQGMASPTRPTRPAPMPTPKLAPARPNTTTFAQRQASQPFRNFTKPAMSRVDPMAMQPQMPMMPQPMTPPPQPFNPDPNPGQLGGGIFGGNLPGMVGNIIGQGIGQMFGGQQPAYMDQGGTQQQWNQFNQGSGGGMGMSYVDPYGPAGQQPMFGAPTVDYGGPAGQQPGQMFGNPNPLTSDYDELEGPGFNTNPSMGGSLFGGGGFSGY